MQQKYGTILNGELLLNDTQLDGYKPVVYAPVPEFDQQTQYAMQDEAVDMGDCIFCGITVYEMPEDAPSEEMMQYVN